MVTNEFPATYAPVGEVVNPTVFVVIVCHNANTLLLPVPVYLETIKLLLFTVLLAPIIIHTQAVTLLGDIVLLSDKIYAC